MNEVRVMPSGHRIYVSRSKKNLGSPEAYKAIKKAARAALEAEKVDEPCIVSVMLTDDEGIHWYNREYRSVDRATDVLSFPMNILEPGAFDAGEAERDPETGDVLLGDMMLSLEHVRAQAEEYGHSEERELCYLTVHSILHLLGYDHVDEGEEKKRMRAREKAIMETIEQ